MTEGVYELNTGNKIESEYISELNRVLAELEIEINKYTSTR